MMYKPNKLYIVKSEPLGEELKKFVFPVIFRIVDESNGISYDVTYDKNGHRTVLKAEDNMVVHIDGGETIVGEKTFTKAVSSPTYPTDDFHLTNKVYVDSKISNFKLPTNWESPQQRFSGLVDKSADATYNKVMVLDADGKAGTKDVGDLGKVSTVDGIKPIEGNIDLTEKYYTKTQIDNNYLKYPEESSNNNSYRVLLIDPLTKNVNYINLGDIHKLKENKTSLVENDSTLPGDTLNETLSYLESGINLQYHDTIVSTEPPTGIANEGTEWIIYR